MWIFSRKSNCIQEDTIGNQLYIIKTGIAEVYVSGNYTRTLNEGE